MEMFPNPHLADLLAAQHRKELLAEAEQWRMVRDAPHGPHSPTLRDRWMIGLARGLIRAGTMIQDVQRQRTMQSEMQEGCEAC
jgi:hypothetical protein